MLAPYLHGKLVGTAVPRFVENQLPELPPLDSLSNAVKRAALINDAVVQGQCDIATAQDLLSMIKIYMDGLDHLELQTMREDLARIKEQLALNPQLSPHVTGGLPPLPGTNIIMNGHGQGPSSPIIDHDLPQWDAKADIPPDDVPFQAQDHEQDTSPITFAHPETWSRDIWDCR
jgi:hypothetical protein